MFKAIPAGFWPGVITGAVVTALVGGFAAYLFTLIMRHWRAVLVLYTIVAAVSLALLVV